MLDAYPLTTGEAGTVRAVALGPDTAHMTGAIADPFVLPEYRSLRRVVLTSRTEVELCPRPAR